MSDEDRRKYEDADKLAHLLYQAIQDASASTPRSQQSASFQLGVSDLGFCPERTRRYLARETEEPTDLLLAWLGNAIGDHAEQAWKAQLFPRAIVQGEITITHEITVGGRRYAITLTGHPDLVDPSGLVIDCKTKDGFDVVERSGPTDDHQMQRHQYAKAAFDAGWFDPDVALEDVKVCNAYIDRSGTEKRVYVGALEPYNPEWVGHSARWLEDVVYHLVNNEEAEKKPPRQVCEKFCGFFDPCRTLDTDVTGLITDELTAESARTYREGLDMIARGERMKRSAKVFLEGVNGHTGDITVRNTWVNPTQVAYSKKGYWRLEVRPMAAPKKGKKS